METYFLTIAIISLCSFLAEHFSVRLSNESMALQTESIPTKILLLITISTLVFVAGFRYYVGTDYGYYYKGFIFANDFEVALQKFSEPGLPLIVRILSWFTDDGAYIVLTCSIITISLFLLSAYKNEKSYLMVTLLFVLIGIWEGTFNGVRQYSAAAILFAGHRFIFERKFWKYLLTVFLAFCFHVSASVMLVLFFLLRNRITTRNVILLIIGTAIVSANYDAIFSFIGLLKNTNFSTLDTYATTTVNILRILVACAPAAVFLLIYLRKEYNAQELTEEQTFYLNAAIIHASAMVAASNSAYLARIGIYTSPFLTVAIPKLIRMDNKRVESVLRVGIIVLYAIYWYVGISGSEALNDFRWIWER